MGPLKSAVDRPRPPDPLSRTSQTSYPSGHALAAATTAPGLVLALLPPGRGRHRWLLVGVTAAGATAISRTYLNAHWLSDSVAGVALGVGYALAAPPAVAAVVHRLGGRGHGRPSKCRCGHCRLAVAEPGGAARHHYGW